MSLTLVTIPFSWMTSDRSFKDFCGIGQSNQSAGNMNNQSNVVSVVSFR
jgi:hypothetical protein